MLDLGRTVLQSAERRPRQLAIVDGAVRLTYAQWFERIRCVASYRPRGSSQHEVDLQLRCASDSYNFDLSGLFTADEKNEITGRWTERSRNIGGTAIGTAHGDRLDIHVESSAFSADMVMVTRSRRQAVTIDSQGGGQIVKASISLSRN